MWSQKLRDAFKYISYLMIDFQGWNSAANWLIHLYWLMPFVHVRRHVPCDTWLSNNACPGHCFMLAWSGHQCLCLDNTLSLFVTILNITNMKQLNFHCLRINCKHNCRQFKIFATHFVWYKAEINFWKFVPLAFKAVSV